jgi:Zn-finger nucleic acid-binding protein
MPEPMLCPIDKTPLVMSERQNIEIDYCPTCRGVWLDRGELDKIIERSAAAEPAAAPAAEPAAAICAAAQLSGPWPSGLRLS